MFFFFKFESVPILIITPRDVPCLEALKQAVLGCDTEFRMSLQTKVP